MSMESGKIEYEIKAERYLSLNLSELWSYRELFFFFTWRDIKVKYKQTVLGFLWVVLQPVILMAIFTIFFGRVLKIPTNGLPYPTFAFTGLILWSFFSSGLSNASSSMVANANIIKKIYFPRLIIPISSILASLFDLLITLVLFYIFALVYPSDIPINILAFTLMLPLAIFMALSTTFGMGTLIAALNVKYRDFRYIIPFLIQILMFLTPVIYPSHMVSNDMLQFLLSLNPMTGAIETLRAALAGQEINYTLVVNGVLVSLGLAVIGIVYFRKTESYFADIA